MADNAARRSRDVKAVCREGRADRCFIRRLSSKMDRLRCCAGPRAQRLGVRAIQSNLRLVVQGQKCTCQIESRAVLRCVRRGPSQVSAGDLDTYIGRSACQKLALRADLLCGAARPPSASYRDRGSSSDVRNVFLTGRPSLSRGSDRKVGLPIIPLLPGPARRSRLTTTPRVDA